MISSKHGQAPEGTLGIAIAQNFETFIEQPTSSYLRSAAAILTALNGFLLIQ
jgi:hypothetical protein